MKQEYKMYRIHSMAGESKISISIMSDHSLPSNYMKKNRCLLFQVPDSVSKITIMGFGNGNKTAMIYGGLSKEYLTKSLQKMMMEFDILGIKIKQISDITIINIAVSGRLCSSIDLNKILLETINNDAEYEPEQFPGLIYRMKEPKCVFLLFRTGRFVIQGLRDSALITPAINNMKKILEKF